MFGSHPKFFENPGNVIRKSHVFDLGKVGRYTEVFCVGHNREMAKTGNCTRKISCTQGTGLILIFLSKKILGQTCAFKSVDRL